MQVQLYPLLRRVVSPRHLCGRGSYGSRLEHFPVKAVHRHRSVNGDVHADAELFNGGDGFLIFNELVYSYRVRSVGDVYTEHVRPGLYYIAGVIGKYAALNYYLTRFDIELRHRGYLPLWQLPEYRLYSGVAFLFLLLSGI